MNMDELKRDVYNLKKNVHPNSRLLIKEKFKERFGNEGNVNMKLMDVGYIELYDRYFLLAKVINPNVVSFNLCRHNYPEGGFEYLTNVGIQDYPELVHVLRNYTVH